MTTTPSAPAGEALQAEAHRAPEARPRVSIGLPVYNGANFLEAAIDSILAQDFEDFELLIGDNGSTDETPRICREVAERDPRVVVHRSEVNRGAAWNFNRLVDLARGEYFKWAAHDDVLAPGFLRRCIEVLDADPDVVIAHARGARIDGRGGLVQQYEEPTYGVEHTPAKRATSVVQQHQCLAVFGVIRRQQLLETERIGPYTGSDLPLLLELALRGRFFEVPEVLFMHREHGDRSIRRHADKWARNAWFDPSLAGKKSAPRWRISQQYLLAAIRSPLPLKERILTVAVVLRWCMQSWKHLAYEVSVLLPVPALQQLVDRLVGEQPKNVVRRC